MLILPTHEQSICVFVYLGLLGCILSAFKIFQHTDSVYVVCIKIFFVMIVKALF